jgi:signal transduction histidine kinase
LETEYRADRAALDYQRARRTLLVLLFLVGIAGLIIVTTAWVTHAALSRRWLTLRFGLLFPALLLVTALVPTKWGRAHFNALLAIGVGLALGFYSLEWILDWNHAWPFRGLWITALAGYLAAISLLPLSKAAATGLTFTAFGVSTVGLFVNLAEIGWVLLCATVVVYTILGAVMVAHVGWREATLREMFLHRRETHLLTEKLREQNEALKQLVAERDKFVAGVLHDLRSPLTAILLGAEMVRHDATLSAEDRTSLLDQIAHSARRIDGFASRFLRQRSLERASTQPNITRAALEPMVERAVEHARIHAGRKRQSVTFTAAAGGHEVLVDELLLDRVMENLLDNAVKYSPLGAPIAVHVEAPADGRVRVIVSDRGPGLSREQQLRLFQPYAVLGPKPTGGEMSTGLGLSLVKHCVEGMGGAVGCESEPDQGARFWVELRRAT